MKLASALVDGTHRTVLVEGEVGLLLPDGTPSVDDAVRDLNALDVVARSRGQAIERPVPELELAPPLRRFTRDVLCTGWNYWDHFEESRGKREGQEPKERPTHPTFFTKAPRSLTGPTSPIAYDRTISAKWDYEAEVAVVIGKAGRSIPQERALEHLAGAMIANDVSQRDLQRAHGGQWLKGKSIDAGSPIGPWLTTMDEIADLQDLQISLELNGEVMQSASTAQMAFSVAQIIAELSWGMTLEPGDVILTGTPAGIGNAREPQVFLNAGDVLVTRVPGLGELRNELRTTDLSSYWSAG